MLEEIGGIIPDLHVGGMLHVFDYPDSTLGAMPLYQRLGDAVSERIRLCEAFDY